MESSPRAEGRPIAGSRSWNDGRMHRAVSGGLVASASVAPGPACAARSPWVSVAREFSLAHDKGPHSAEPLKPGAIRRSSRDIGTMLSPDTTRG